MSESTEPVPSSSQPQDIEANQLFAAISQQDDLSQIPGVTAFKNDSGIEEAYIVRDFSNMQKMFDEARLMAGQKSVSEMEQEAELAK